MKTEKKPYRFVEASGRPIQCIFRHIPGKRFSTGTYDRDEAIAWALEFLRNDGVKLETIPTLGEFAKDFFIRTDSGSIQARNLAFNKSMSPSWPTDRQRYLDNYILPQFGGYFLDAITPRAIEAWTSTLKGRKVKRLSNNYKLNILAAFKLVMEDAVRMGYITVNPVTVAMKPASTLVKPRRVLSLYEQNLLFPDSVIGRVSVWGNIQWATYFSIMFDTGFRPGEAGGLQVGDIYQTPNGMAVFTNHTINGYTRQPAERVKTSGKGAENRVGLLSPITEELVKAHIADRGISDPDEYLFRTIHNGYFYAAVTSDRFAEVMEKYGIEDCVEYCLRHTFLTYKRGEIDDQTLAIAMGHMGGGPRDDYDHRSAEILISQLEKKRISLFKRQEELSVVPLYKAK